MKRRIIFSFLFSVLVFIVAFALFCPNIILENGEVYKISTKRYITVAVISLVAFFAFFFWDTVYNLCGKFIDLLRLKKTCILKFTIGVVLAFVSASVLDLIFHWVTGPDSAGRLYGTASFFIFLTFALIIFIFTFEINSIKQHPERAVAFIIAAVGMLIIFTEPFSHNSSDEDSHYYFSVHNSFVGEALLSKADLCVKATDGFAINNSHAIVPSLKKIADFNDLDQYASYIEDVRFSIPHLPAGAAIAVARLFGADFRTKFVCGQLVNLFVYVALCYFAIKKLKNGKMIMSVIALFPTSILLACNFSYDPWITGFAMLGTAYFVTETEQPEKKMQIRDTVIMCGAFLLAAIPKQTYLTLFILPLFLMKNYKSKKDKLWYYLIIGIFFAVILLSFALRSAASLGGRGDLRGGAVNPSEQLSFILNNPLQYAKSLLKLLLNYFSPLSARKYITFYSYLGNGGSAFIFLVALIFCAVTDKSTGLRLRGMNFIKILTVLITVGTICLIATAMYIAFTPVGNPVINGCQPRYLIPLLSPLMLTLFYPRFSKICELKYYNHLILLSITACLFIKTVTVVTIPML